MTNAHVPDALLVRAALRGDETAFAQLVRRHLRKAMAVALEYSGTREDAEDVVQETFRRVCEGLSRYDETRPFEPWFYTILRNTARNAAQRQRVRAHDRLSSEQSALEPGPYELARRSQLRQQIEQAMSALPPMQKGCFQLCLVEGMSSGEAAVALGIAESTVRVHVLKARRALQALLQQWREEKTR